MMAWTSGLTRRTGVVGDNDGGGSGEVYLELRDELFERAMSSSSVTALAI